MTKGSKEFYISNKRVYTRLSSLTDDRINKLAEALGETRSWVVADAVRAFVFAEAGQVLDPLAAFDLAKKSWDMSSGLVIEIAITEAYQRYQEVQG